MLVHIDDFLLAGSSKEEAIALGEKLDEMCEELGVAVSHEKSENGISEGVVHEFAFNAIAETMWMAPLKFVE